MGELIFRSSIFFLLLFKPVAQDDRLEVDEDSRDNNLSVLDGQGKDTDVDGDNLTIINIGQPNQGGVVIINSNKTGLIYTPKTNFYGQETFTYTISDGKGSQDTATVTIKVKSINDAPTATDNNYQVNEDNRLQVDATKGVLSNDQDIDSKQLSAIVSQKTNNGNLDLNPDGSFTYTPKKNYYGKDQFTYIVKDEQGSQDTANVAITVNPIQDVPIAQDDRLEVDEDSRNNNLSVLDGQGKDTDVDGDNLTIINIGQPNQGGVVIINSKKTGLIYTPKTNFYGQETFTYTISDGKGSQDTATVTITVKSINDAPTATDNNYQINEDNRLRIDKIRGVLNNDRDIDSQRLTVTVRQTTNNGRLNLKPDGSFTYTPKKNYYGKDQFTYIVKDEQGAQNTAQVNIRVNPVNDPPVALDDPYTITYQRQEIHILNVLSNDRDDDQDDLRIVRFTQAKYGKVHNLGKSLTYLMGKFPSNIIQQNQSGYFIEDEFTYTVTDGNISVSARVKLKLKIKISSPIK